MSIDPSDHAVATLLAWCEDSNSHWQAPGVACIAHHQEIASELALFLRPGQFCGKGRARPQHLQRSHSQPSSGLSLISSSERPQAALSPGMALDNNNTG